MKNFLILTTTLLLLTGCGLTTARPKLEMTLAQAAFISAKEAGGQSLAPALYRKAEFYYLKAKSSYRRKFFNKAKKYADLSKRFSEKAEFKAYKKKALDNI
ncbi:MAG: hypothetical protein BM556_05335 [Bacteriovorax sp. MedPE-SWde]|nr:MAG: hypothetical protein BM556_05335 [Bacteriovorax sp. MedPE-SWde]